MKKETYKFIFSLFTDKSNSLRKFLFLIFISIIGALLEIGFLSIINIILQPNYTKLVFSNKIFILIIFLSLFFGFFKIYILSFCGNIVNTISQNMYRNSYLFSLNPSLSFWDSEESSFITKNTISNYRITNSIIVPLTFAIPPFTVSIFLSIYLIYKYPLVVLIGVFCLSFYYFIIVKIVSPSLKIRSKIMQIQDNRMKALLSFSFRDRLNLFLNDSFQNLFNKYEKANMKVRKAEAETIVFNNSPRAMLEVAIYMIVVLAYYLLIFNNQNSNENYIVSGELATILICFLRLTSIANQIYTVLASLSANNSQLEEMISTEKTHNSFLIRTKKSKIEIPYNTKLIVEGNSDYLKIPFYIKDKIIISSGEITTIEGESGIGKTTFSQLLMLSIFNDQSSNILKFKLQNKIIFDNNQKYLGSLFCLNAQNLLVDGITIYEFLESVNPNKTKEISKVLSDLFNKSMVISIIEKRKKLTELSGGEFQRILIARTILSDAKFVFLDETTSGLDNKNELKSIELLRKKNIGILIISHKGVAKEIAKNRYVLLSKEHKINIEKI